MVLTLPVSGTDLLPVCSHTQYVLEQYGTVVQSKRRTREGVVKDTDHVTNHASGVQIVRSSWNKRQ